MNKLMVGVALLLSMSGFATDKGSCDINIVYSSLQIKEPLEKALKEKGYNITYHSDNFTFLASKQNSKDISGFKRLIRLNVETYSSYRTYKAIAEISKNSKTVSVESEFYIESPEASDLSKKKEFRDELLDAVAGLDTCYDLLKKLDD